MPISLAEHLLSAHKVVVRKVIAAKVVEIRNALSSRIFGEWRRGLVDVGKDLLCAAQIANVEE